MAPHLARRDLLLGMLAPAAPLTIDTHIHLFDPLRFPYAPNATYTPSAYTLEDHAKLAAATGLNHAIIVHPEPYQDDHRSLEYFFDHEPQPGYFKGTCLFDPFRDDAPSRMRELVRRHPNRIVALRIHAMSRTPEQSGPIRNRDLADPRMAACWKAATDLGLAAQVHFIPAQAANVRALAARFRDTTVILDHMGRPGQGTEDEYLDVLKMAALPRVILKYSNWEEYKGDLPSLTRRLFEAFGPERMIWGVLGNTPAEYRTHLERFEDALSFASAADRAKIRGETARRLFFR
jgi:predicted TIM-barrel fold metal-dependent hydrolase